LVEIKTIKAIWSYCSGLPYTLSSSS